MAVDYTRRDFVKTGLAVAGLGAAGLSKAANFSSSMAPLFKISLAEWSLNGPLFDGEIDNLDFPVLAAEHGIMGVEYVNQFFMDKATDESYLTELKNRAEGEGVENVLIMCDQEGHLGDPDRKARMQAVENHKKWVDAARHIGCHAIRVNGRSEGSYNEQAKLVADGFTRLVEYAAERDMNVILENHGGLSSNPDWVVKVVNMVDHPRFGTLPDFGNYRISDEETYDSYEGVEKMMPYAKGVSVKPMGYYNHGNLIEIDLTRMMKIVTDAGYHGYCGIEHGPDGSEWEGIVEIRKELERVREELG